MKKLLLIFPLLILCHFTYAQDIKIEKGMYKKNGNLKQFEGTWQAKKEDETLLVVLEKYKVHYPRIDISADQILGWYKYTKGEYTVVNTLNNVGSSNYKDANFIGETKNNNLRTLSFTVATPNRETLLKATLKYRGKNSSRAILKFRFPTEVNMKIQMHKNKDKDKKSDSMIPVPSTWHMKHIKK